MEYVDRLCRSGILRSESKKDVAAFERCYVAHHHYVRSILFRFETQGNLEDLVQEVFFKVWDNIDRFENRSSLRTWIVKIAVNLAIDSGRRAKQTSLRENLDDVKSKLDFEKQFADSDILRLALARLREPLRVVLILNVVEGYSLQETAEILEIPVGTVKSRVHNARSEMRQLLVQMGVSA